MFVCGYDWNKKVINGFMLETNGYGGFDNILNQLKQDDDSLEIYELLSLYLKKLWYEGSYDIVIDFMVSLASSNSVIKSFLIDKYFSDSEWDSLMILVHDIRLSSRTNGLYAPSLIQSSEQLYVKGLLGKDIDLETLTKKDIDFISSVLKGSSYAKFAPMFRYLVATDKLELLWYLFSNHIVDSLVNNPICNVYNYLNMYSHELIGVINTFSNGITVTTNENNEYQKLFEMYKDNDIIGMKGYSDLILFGSNKIDKSINKELLDSLLYLYNRIIKDSNILDRRIKEEITYTIGILMVHLNNIEGASEFIYENSKYYTLDFLKNLGLLTTIAIQSNDFDTVNMLYSIFLTEKSFVNNLVNKLPNHIKTSTSYLKDLRELFNKSNPNNLYEKRLSNIDYSLKETKFEEKLLHNIESFRFKFFEEADTDSLISYSENYITGEVDLSDVQLLSLCVDLNLRLKVISEGARLNSILTDEKINFIKVCTSVTAVNDTENHIETLCIPTNMVQLSKDIYNKFKSMGLRVNNIKHKKYYDIIHKILSEKATILYMNNMSDIVEEILKEQPEKYKRLFKKEWDEVEAERIFIDNFREHKGTAKIESYFEGGFNPTNYKKMNIVTKKYYDGAYNYFKDTYNAGDENYKEILDNIELRKLILTAEWLWDKEVSEGISDTEGMEYTYIVGNYLKIVEIYLYGKIKKIYDDLEVPYNKYDLSQSTLGNLYYKVSDTPEILNNTLLSHIDNYLSAINNTGNYTRSPVFMYLKEFTDSIRNGYFHKHVMVSFAEAERIRHKTLYIIRRISTDFK